MKQLLLFTFLSTFINVLPAQPLGLEEHFSQIRAGRNQLVKRSQLDNWRANTNSITPYYAFLYDSEQQVRNEAVRIVAQVALGHEDSDFRQTAVLTLTEMALQNNAVLSSNILSMLKSFPPLDFNASAIRNIEKFIFNGGHHLEEFIMLAGYLQMKPTLSTAFHLYESKNELRRAINLAMARCGDKSRIQAVVQSVKEKPLNDDLVYDYAPILLYVRDKATFDYLLSLMLDDRKNCTPADAEIPGSILCGYRIMEYVAPLIKDFPIKINPLSGALETDDYEKALEQVRAWIKATNYNYQLITSVY